jgi:histidinol phosphatase-like enzyme
MKVIFLDFDGVLNSIQDSIFYSRTKGDYGFKFSPLACSNIQWLLEQDPSIKIVISSTWRVLHSL